MWATTEYGAVVAISGRSGLPGHGWKSFRTSNPVSGYTAAATAGTKCASSVRHRGFGGGTAGGSSSSPAPTTGDDTVTPGNISQVGEAACSREETKVSLSLSVEVLTSSIKETSPPWGLSLAYQDEVRPVVTGIFVSRSVLRQIGRWRRRSVSWSGRGGLEGLFNVRDVGSLYRFKRRLFSRPRSTRTHPIPPLRLQWQSVRIPGAPVQAFNSTLSVHENRAGHRGIPQDTGCRHAPVSRRLASKEPVEVASGTSTRPHIVLGDKTGLPRKRGKVPISTHAVPSIPGIDPRSYPHARFPEREEGCQSVASGFLAPSTEPSAGKDLAEALGPSVQSTRVGPHGLHSSYPTYAPQSVDTSVGQPIPPDIPRPRVAQGSRVVGVTGQPDGRPPVPQARSDYDNSHGCLHGGLGRSPRRLGDLGPVVVGLGQTPHQLARTTGSVADSAALLASGPGHCCGCPYGQYHYSGLHQQGGWNSVSHLVLPGTRSMGLVQATRDLPGCQPHIGSQERPGGCPVQRETQPPHRVVPPQDSGSAHIRALADSPCGSLRIGEEPQTSGVLLSAPLSDVERNKRSDAELGEPTNLIPRVLRKLRLQWSAWILLVAPFWPSQPWFRQLTSMLTDLPRVITPKDNLLKNSVTGMFYPKPDRMRLAVWPLSANPSLTEAFHRELQRRQPGLGENRLAGFMIPVFSTTNDGAWSEVWVPLKPL